MVDLSSCALPVLRPARCSSAVERAVAEIAAGRAVVLVAVTSSSYVANLVLGAERVTPESVAFMVRYGSGFLRVPVTEETCERLDLAQMVRHNEQPHSPAYTVTVDASEGISTGISARDRCHTIRLLADETSRPEDLTRPGHVLPIRAAAGGLLERAGITEAVVELARLAALRPAGVMSELVTDSAAHGLPDVDEVLAFAAEWHLTILRLDELIAYRHAMARRPRAITPKVVRFCRKLTRFRLPLTAP